MRLKPQNGNTIEYENYINYSSQATLFAPKTYIMKILKHTKN